METTVYQITCVSCGMDHQIQLEPYEPIASRACPGCDEIGYASRYIRMDIGLSEVCNLTCNMCRRPQEREFMTFDRIQGLLTDARKIGVKTISFSGGEPFVHPQFREILALALDTDFNVELVTNGTLVRSADLPSLERLKCVTVSLDGPKEQHDYIRGQDGTWAKTMGCLALLSQSSATWGTNTVVQACNSAHILQTWREIESVGKPSYVGFTHVEVVPETAHLQPSGRQSESVKTQLSQIQAECLARDVHFNDAALLGDAYSIFADKSRRYRPIGGCPIPGTFLGVSKYGVFPCWHQGRYLKEDSLINALESELCRSILAEALDRNCVGCNAANYSWNTAWIDGMLAAHREGEWLEGVVYLSDAERRNGQLSRGKRTLPIIERRDFVKK